MISKPSTCLVLPVLACWLCFASAGDGQTKLQGRFPAIKRDAPAATATKADARSGDDLVKLSGEQIDIRLFVRMVGRITQKTFIVADEVKGRITVVTPDVKREDVFPLFDSMLASIGCSVVEDGGVYRVVKLAPRIIPSAPVVGPDGKLPLQGVVMKVIPLLHVSAQSLKEALDVRISGGKGGGVSAIRETNHLLVTDTVANIREIEKLIKEIDQPGMARSTEVIRLKFAGAEDLASQLGRAMENPSTSSQRLASRFPSAKKGTSGTVFSGSVVVADPHSNSLLVSGTAAEIREIKRIVTLLDVDSVASKGRFNAIPLKYISAEEAAKSINALLSQSTADGKSRPIAGRRIGIEAMKASNALLVDARPGDFEVVKKLVEQIDTAPAQVHIEVVIAEIRSDKGLEWGVEMAAVDMPSGLGDTVLQGGSRFSEGVDSIMNQIQSGIFPRGISLGVATGTSRDATGRIVPSYPALLNFDAIKRNGEFRLRSRPSLVAQDNAEASISIVEEIPVLKSTIQGTEAGRDVIQNIERMDVGIKLKLTPHVIDGNKIRMELNPSIEAVIDPGPTGTQFAPTIAKREVSTTVTVADGNVIVLAGLTRENKTTIVKKTPILGSIPLLGLLFRHSVDSTEKTDMVIFVIPRIMSDPAMADTIKKEWQEKAGLTPEEKK